MARQAGELGIRGAEPPAEVDAVHALERALLGALSSPEAPPQGWEALALTIHAAQAAHNPVLAALAPPSPPTRWEEIPALPVDLFKELEVASFPLHLPHTTFLTSGTTRSAAARGRHHLRTLDLTRASAEAGWALRHGGLPKPVQVVSLCPTEAPDSSLGHMVNTLARAWGLPVIHAFDPTTGARPGTWEALARPSFLAATAFALDALLQSPGHAPADARWQVMVTGGFKGREVRLDAPGLYRALGERLPGAALVAEYGMCELSSCLWAEARPAGEPPGPYLAPPWLYPYTVDPVSGAPLADGEEGLLRFVDVCNLWSSLAIETMDLGRVEPTPAGRAVTLLGRAAGAELRGCSLRAEDALLAARGRV